MVDIKRQWQSVANKNTWTARAATIVAKAKATKMVWFPPKPEQAGQRHAATTEQAAKNMPEQPTGAAKTTD
jgi:hypothetical protein